MLTERKRRSIRSHHFTLVRCPHFVSLCCPLWRCKLTDETRNLRATLTGLPMKLPGDPFHCYCTSLDCPSVNSASAAAVTTKTMTFSGGIDCAVSSIGARRGDRRELVSVVTVLSAAVIDVLGRTTAVVARNFATMPDNVNNFIQITTTTISPFPKQSPFPVIPLADTGWHRGVRGHSAAAERHTAEGLVSVPRLTPSPLLSLASLGAIPLPQHFQQQQRQQ